MYRYEFDGNGRIKTAYTSSLTYVAGVPFDSTTYVKRYEYNAKGQIIKVFDTIDSTWETKFYNEFDSLIADYSINNYGDTTRMTIINYLNGKTNKTLERILSEKIPENLENLKKDDLRNYDTLSFITEFVYEGDQHIKSLSYDKDGTVSAEVDLIYEDGLKTKTITYSFLGDTKYIKETTIYMGNETSEPDALTIGTQGDTIGFTRTIFQDQNKIIINHIGQFNIRDIKYYDNDGQLIGTVLLDLNEKVKTVNSYSYDRKGNLVQEANYRERINNAR